MLITKEWSEPRPLAYGRDIIVRSSHVNFSYKIQSGGKTVEGIIRERVHTIAASDELIRMIQVPYISFRANTNDELHVEFEQP